MEGTLKSDPRLGADLTEEQKLAKKVIYENKIVVLRGKAGTSKTFVACHAALTALIKKSVDGIVIMRSTVSTEDIGFLPGDVKDKLMGFVAPVLNNMKIMLKPSKVDELLENGVIQILPLQHAKGITFTKKFIIVEEAQNYTREQIKIILSRFGSGSKMVITGDINQVDLINNKNSCFESLCSLNIPELQTYELKKNYRDPIVELILDNY